MKVRRFEKKKMIGRVGYVAGVGMIFAMVGMMGVIGVSETANAVTVPQTAAEMDSVCRNKIGGTPSQKHRCKLGPDWSQVSKKMATRCTKYGGTITQNGNGMWLCVWDEKAKGGRTGSSAGAESDGVTGERTPGSTTGGGGTGDASTASTDTTGQPSFDDMGENGAPDSECGEGQVKTSILGGGGCVDAGKEGEGIFVVLNVALQVMTYGVGILATLGFVISGYVYLTAKDDASKVQKAKDRILQIVIGVVIYAVFWSFMQFILPGGLFGDGSG